MSRLQHHNHRLTTTGYYVAGIKIGIYQDKKRYGTRYRSGRITENPQGEWLDPAKQAEWDMQGRAINHNFGDLVY